MLMAMSMAGYMLLARAVDRVNMVPTNNDDEDRPLLLLPLQVSSAVSSVTSIILGSKQPSTSLSSSLGSS